MAGRAFFFDSYGLGLLDRSVVCFFLSDVLLLFIIINFIIVDHCLSDYLVLGV